MQLSNKIFLKCADLYMKKQGNHLLQTAKPTLGTDYTTLLSLSYNDITRHIPFCQDLCLRNNGTARKSSQRGVLPGSLHEHVRRRVKRKHMTRQEFLRLARLHPVAAALKSSEDMQVALDSDAPLLFMLKGDAFQLAPFVSQVHRRGKGLVVHVDLVSGVGKDRAGIQYLHSIDVDAIITSRSQLVAAGKAEGLVTIQRLLLLDDSALETGVRTIARAAPDFVEVLPGIIFPEVASTLQKLLAGPFIAGGFIRTDADVARIRNAGAILSSSSTYELWHRTLK
jgi:glycerol uptake operon antiterminator